MEPNPYESPQIQRSNVREKRQEVPWGRVCGYGLCVLAVSVAVFSITATFSYMPAQHPVLSAVHMAIVKLCLAGAACGTLAAVIGGLAYLIKHY